MPTCLPITNKFRKNKGVGNIKIRVEARRLYKTQTDWVNIEISPSANEKVKWLVSSTN